MLDSENISNPKVIAGCFINSCCYVLLPLTIVYPNAMGSIYGALAATVLAAILGAAIEIGLYRGMTYPHRRRYAHAAYVGDYDDRAKWQVALNLIASTIAGLAAVSLAIRDKDKAPFGIGLVLTGTQFMRDFVSFARYMVLLTYTAATAALLMLAQLLINLPAEMAINTYDVWRAQRMRGGRRRQSVTVSRGGADDLDSDNDGALSPGASNAALALLAAAPAAGQQQHYGAVDVLPVTRDNGDPTDVAVAIDPAATQSSEVAQRLQQQRLDDDSTFAPVPVGTAAQP